MSRPSDTVFTAPTIWSEGGRAWCRELASFPPLVKRAGVASWIIEAPWAHPIWHSYGLTIVHLRDTPGLPPPIIYLAGATHELVLVALDPEKPRQPMIDGASLQFLSPPNFVAQLELADDAEAQRKAEWVAREIVERRLNPDTDALGMWVRLFGNNMIRREARG